MTGHDQLPVLLDPAAMKRDMRHRLKIFNEWLKLSKSPWYEADLTKFGDYLQKTKGLTPATVLASLSTIKSRYRDLVFSDQLDGLLAASLPASTELEAAKTAARKAIHTAATLDTRYLGVERVPNLTYLSTDQIDELLGSPSVRTLSGLRDATIMGLLLCTGMNETELCELTVDDVGQRPAVGEWMIHVPETGEGRARTIKVFDDRLFSREWLAEYVTTLLQETEVKWGAIFRGLRRDGRTVRPYKLTPRAVRQILKDYPVLADVSTPTTFTALDLRRTFARRLFLAGVDLESIQRNLGLGYTATQEYIGGPLWQGDQKWCRKADGGRLVQRLPERT